MKQVITIDFDASEIENLRNGGVVYVNDKQGYVFNGNKVILATIKNAVASKTKFIRAFDFVGGDADTITLKGGESERLHEGINNGTLKVGDRFKVMRRCGIKDPSTGQDYTQETLNEELMQGITTHGRLVSLKIARIDNESGAVIFEQGDSIIDTLPKATNAIDSGLEIASNFTLKD